jgi:hypothetical protein
MSRITRRGPVAERARATAREKKRVLSELREHSYAARRALDWNGAAEFALRSAKLFCRLHGLMQIKTISERETRLACGCKRESISRANEYPQLTRRQRNKMPRMVIPESEIT